MLIRRLKKFPNRIYNFFKSHLKYYRALYSFKLIKGPKYINLKKDEIVCIILFRDMGYYLEYFYKYYRSIGVNYFICVDNGSTDDSISIVSKWENTILLKSELNFKHYQRELRQIATTRYCSDGWRLAVDPDEILEYFGSKKISLQTLIGDLEKNKFTGVVAYMLDMIPENKLSEISKTTFEESIKRNVFYSLDDIYSYGYYDKDCPIHGIIKNNKLNYENVEWKFGGIRKKYFGEECCLTKHPIFYYKNGVIPFVHPHLTTGLSLADFTVVLKHYKFSGTYIEREKKLIDDDRIFHDETRKRSSIINDGKSFSFKMNDFEDNSSIEYLIDRGFVGISDRAISFYKKNSEK